MKDESVAWRVTSNQVLRMRLQPSDAAHGQAKVLGGESPSDPRAASRLCPTRRAATTVRLVQPGRGQTLGRQRRGQVGQRDLGRPFPGPAGRAVRCRRGRPATASRLRLVRARPRREWRCARRSSGGTRPRRARHGTRASHRPWPAWRRGRRRGAWDCRPSGAVGSEWSRTGRTPRGRAPGAARRSAPRWPAPRAIRRCRRRCSRWPPRAPRSSRRAGSSKHQLAVAGGDAERIGELGASRHERRE